MTIQINKNNNSIHQNSLKSFSFVIQNYFTRIIVRILHEMVITTLHNTVYILKRPPVRWNVFKQLYIK